MTRLEAVIFIEESSGSQVDESYAKYNPFSDVPEEAESYVGCAYRRGIVKGVSEDFFDCDRIVTRAEFLTMVLRLLSYKDGNTIYSWDNPFERAYLSGIYDYEEDLGCDFTKDEAKNIMAKAFFAHTHHSPVTYLYESNVPGEEIAEEVELEAQNRSAYREALSKISAGNGLIYYKKELLDYMIIFGYLIGAPHVSLSSGYIVRKSDGEVTKLPMPKANFSGGYVMPQEIWLSDDETVLYYISVSERDLIWEDRTIVQSAGTYEYSVDLKTMEQTMTYHQ